MLLFVLMSSLGGMAQTNVFSDLTAFTQSVLKGKGQVLQQATGDLNEDGLEDAALVLQRDKGDHELTQQLYVLLQESAGGYQVAEHSKEEPSGGSGSCWVESLEIKNGSVYIQDNAKTANEMEAYTHQFKLYKGAWRLVSLRVYVYEHGEGIDKSTEHEMNFLTGAIKMKTQVGDDKPEIERRKRSFSPAYLRDFDFYGFGLERAKEW